MKNLKQFDNIAKIIEASEDGAHVYIVMEYYGRGSLNSVIHTFQSEQEIIEMFRKYAMEFSL